MSDRRRSKWKRPRQLWLIKPFDRIHEGNRAYCRARDKRRVEREAILQWGDRHH